MTKLNKTIVARVFILLVVPLVISINIHLASAYHLQQHLCIVRKENSYTVYIRLNETALQDIGYRVEGRVYIIPKDYLALLNCGITVPRNCVVVNLRERNPLFAMLFKHIGGVSIKRCGDEAVITLLNSSASGRLSIRPTSSNSLAIIRILPYNSSEYSRITKLDGYIDKVFGYYEGLISAHIPAARAARNVFERFGVLPLERVEALLPVRVYNVIALPFNTTKDNVYALKQTIHKLETMASSSTLILLVPRNYVDALSGSESSAANNPLSKVGRNTAAQAGTSMTASPSGLNSSATPSAAYAGSPGGSMGGASILIVLVALFLAVLFLALLFALPRGKT